MVNKNTYLIESNHDEVMLMDGPYPRFLKERVISDQGHLSNHTTASYLKKIVGEDTHTIILAHLSENNNTEELAVEQVLDELKNNKNKFKIITAKQHTETETVEI
jgi:phosphoribosyl 1,2-cyclic phosphodiesterase